MLLADVTCQGYDGYNVFATDVIVTCMQWLMGTTLFRDNSQLFPSATITLYQLSHMCFHLSHGQNISLQQYGNNICHGGNKISHIYVTLASVTIN